MKIPLSRINFILEIPSETQILEFKRLTGDAVVSKTIKTIVAMANTDGGNIVVGIDDPEKTKLKGEKRIFGIEESQENYDEIKRNISKIDPKGNISISFNEYELQETNKTFAIIVIGKNTNSISSIDNKVYIRGKKGNIELNTHEIIEYAYARGYKTSDNELVDVDFELLNTELLKSYFNKNKHNIDDFIQELFNLGLAKKENEKIKPTRAAVLLFADHPTLLMETKCAVKIFKYKGNIEQYKEVPNLIGQPKIIEGNLIKTIRDTQEYVLEQLQNGIEFKTGFINKYKIPERVIKEAVVNAIIHRDYYLKRDIEISIFEDRIEFLSPGLFVDNITISNIGIIRSNKYRNDLLVKHLRFMDNPPNLDKNEGVKAMRSEMSENNLYPPIFISYPTISDSVKLVLLNELIMTD
ncbi:MAG: putative DNA binding domain-containing protein [Limnohabitans sp.]|nr:putative DNA binding domain-containing protein [Limnohabitans sp.]